MSKLQTSADRVKALEYDLNQLDLFSSPAQKPASVPGGSGAGLVGNPSQILDFCESLPVTMSGDAWESAANFVISARCVA